MAPRGPALAARRRRAVQGLRERRIASSRGAQQLRSARPSALRRLRMGPAAGTRRHEQGIQGRGRKRRHLWRSSATPPETFGARRR